MQKHAHQIKQDISETSPSPRTSPSPSSSPSQSAAQVQAGTRLGLTRKDCKQAGNFRPQGRTEPLEYSSSITSKSTQKMVSQAKT